MPSRLTDADIEARISAEPMSGCWLWVGSRSSSTGYGQVGSNPQRRAHRVVYEKYRGQIPTGLQLDHLCRVPLCVNPDHLEPVTCRENVLRGIGPTAENARKTHCKRGHPLKGRNLLMKGTYRTCRTCQYASVVACKRMRKARHRT